MVAVRHLGFGQTFFEILGFFSIFKTWPPPPWISIIGWRGPLSRDASACQISSKRSIYCRDMAIFKNDGRPPSWICLGHISTMHKEVLGGLYHWANVSCDRCSSLDSMNVSIFRSFGLKTPIHAPKIVFFGDDHLKMTATHSFIIIL